MLFSKLLIPTLKEVPSDVDITSAKLMIRSGIVNRLSSGIYEFLPLGVKILKKIEKIIRHEMDVIGGQEVTLSLMLPKELLLETDRWNVYGKELFRLKDRKGAEFCLVPTAEEGITDLIRRNVKSYKQLPITLYQFGTKFRDEIRPRFGVIRAKEFLMKDAYSFHADEFDLEKYYKIMFNAYMNICIKCGLKFRVVEATSGAIGGSFSHEFVALADAGEEEIVWCNCGYGASTEKAKCFKIERFNNDGPLNMEEVVIPNINTIVDAANFLNLSVKKIIKTVIYITDGNPVAVLIRGDHEINETKLKDLLGASKILIADEQTVISIINVPLVFLGPVGLKNIKIIADTSVIDILNAFVGANKKNCYIKNVNYKIDYDVDIIADVRKIMHGDICSICKKEKLMFSKGIEIGHIFKLGNKYSELMKATYVDKNGKKKFISMGCYGIGVTRILAAAIEQSYDNNGIIWPNSIAPFEVVVVPVDYKNSKINKITKKIYEELSSNGLDVLIDDRNERIGVKFKDADLIGIPYRITIGEKNLANGNVDLKSRKNTKSKILKPECAVAEITQMFYK
ncbi:MAG: proline--tRNA ligase [Endomicrobium sp.]|nr:proline--tRNA ligase [Endomicrobium sp.]